MSNLWTFVEKSTEEASFFKDMVELADTFNGKRSQAPNLAAIRAFDIEGL